MNRLSSRKAVISIRTVSYTHLDVYKRQDSVVLETVKRSEDGSGVILRLYESRNQRVNAKVTLFCTPAKVMECSLLEEPDDGSCGVRMEQNGFAFTIRPYEIKTFKVVF